MMRHRQANRCLPHSFCSARMSHGVVRQKFVFAPLPFDGSTCQSAPVLSICNQMWCLHTPPSVVGSEDEAAHLSLCSRETELVFGLEAWSLTAEERVTKGQGQLCVGKRKVRRRMAVLDSCCCVLDSLDISLHQAFVMG